MPAFFKKGRKSGLKPAKMGDARRPIGFPGVEAASFPSF
jgi:hypothetical protein